MIKKLKIIAFLFKKSSIYFVSLFVLTSLLIYFITWTLETRESGGNIFTQVGITIAKLLIAVLCTFAWLYLLYLTLLFVVRLARLILQLIYKALQWCYQKLLHQKGRDTSVP